MITLKKKHTHTHFELDVERRNCLQFWWKKDIFPENGQPCLHKHKAWNLPQRQKQLTHRIISLFAIHIGLVCKVLCKLLKKDYNIHNDSYITKVNNSLGVVSKGFLEADTIENDTKQISLPATNDNSWLIITSQGLFTRRNLP